MHQYLPVVSNDVPDHIPPIISSVKFVAYTQPLQQLSV